MPWETIRILVSICIYFIWFILLYYICIKRTTYNEHDDINITYEKLPIRVWFVIISIITVFIPVVNVISSIFLPLLYLTIHCDEDNEPVLRARDDAFCRILKVIGSFLLKPLN